MKATILAIGAFGLLVTGPALAQMDNSMSNGSMKAPMGQSKTRGSMASGKANESKATGARENRMAMKHRKHHKKHHRMHKATAMPTKTGM